MIPLQEIDVHTNKKVLYKVHILALTENTTTFFTEVLVYDSDFEIPFQSNVVLRENFDSAKGAFEHALNWIYAYSNKHGYTITRINNPCNCEFLSKSYQQEIVNKKSLQLQVQVNGV